MKKLIAILWVVLAAAALQAGEPRKVAVFVQNRTRVPAMAEQVDAIRERIIGALSEVPDMMVIDSTLTLDAYDESPNAAKALGCDYVAVASIVGASSMKRNLGGRLSKVFTLRMSLKVTDVNGVGVDGMPVWVRQLPVVDAADADEVYFEMLIDQWSNEMTQAIAQKAPGWRAPSRPEAKLARIYISTTIDKTVAELESQTKGASGEQLVELRKVVGGAVVSIDGLVAGSAPNTFEVAPGLHTIEVSRAWMTPYRATLNVQDGASLEVALEMSAEGVAKWGTQENLRAELARKYAEAAMQRGVKVNLDSSGWHDVSQGNHTTVIAP